jgi:hypothetical protein
MVRICGNLVYASYVGYAMYAGSSDFPSVDSF